MSARSLHSPAAFDSKIDALIVARVKDGTTGFSELLYNLPAVYPSELLASLDRLVVKGMIAPSLATSIRQQAAVRPSLAVEGRSLLPLPHPLDFEWRFAPDSARALLNLAADLTAVDGELLLFGTPGLAVEALTLPIDRRLTFLAESNCVTDRICALNSATGSPLSIAFCGGGMSGEIADAVLLDPPWYMDFVRPMLTAAAHACRVGGVVLVSLPPLGTRPGAEADRTAVIDFCRYLGLNSIQQVAQTIRYETPFFERNALAAAGIYPPPHWRRGDLFIFRKIQTQIGPAFVVGTRARKWTEVTIDRMRLFIRAGDEARSGGLSLTSLVEGDILPTVSRRDPRRRLAQVWTSGNRIFQTDNPQLLLEVATSSAGQAIDSSVQPHLWGTIHDRGALERVADSLRALATLESQEERGWSVAAAKRSVTWNSRSTHYWSRSTAITSG